MTDNTVQGFEHVTFRPPAGSSAALPFTARRQADGQWLPRDYNGFLLKPCDASWFDPLFDAGWTVIGTPRQHAEAAT